MQNFRFVSFLFACFLLFACGTTQETINESPQEISKALRDGRLIKPGDWIRATTFHDQIHEFSFVGMTENEVHGGDAIMPLGQIRQLEVFPLVRREGEALNPLIALTNAAFEDRLIARINAESDIVATILINGKKHTMRPSSIEKETLVGKVLEYSEDPNGEYVSTRWTHQEIPISSVVQANVRECHWFLYEKHCRLIESLNRWGNSEAARMEVLQSKVSYRSGGNGILGAGDWVKATLSNDQIQEFQYQELIGKTLIGGDSSIAVSDIESMEIYPLQFIAPPEMSTGEKVGATLAGVVGLGFVIILTGGLAAPVFIIP